jgi:hypothetical protein
MKRILFLFHRAVAIGAMAVLLAACHRQATLPKPAASTEVGQLQSEAASLQSRIKTLEARIRELQQPAVESASAQPPMVQFPKQGVIVQHPGFPPSISDAFADPNHPSKIWGEGECNGWKYYLIPLGAPPSDSH